MSPEARERRSKRGIDRFQWRNYLPIAASRYWLPRCSTSKLGRMTKTLFAAALVTILLSADSAGAQPVCGDVNDSGGVTSSDALAVLREAVGQPVDLICDACGSLCAGDPRYLLGEWIFESEFESVLYENNYDLVAVDEVNCEILGEDLDDAGVVYAYAGAEYDYVLLSPNETFCDLFVFDYVGPDEVEGTNFLLDLDEFGNCDFDNVFDEGPMIGDRVGDVSDASSADASAASPKSSASETPISTIRASTLVEPRFAPLIDRVRTQYEKRRR